MILHMLNHMISGAMPILYPQIMDEFTLSYSQLGLLRSANTLVTGIPQMFVGFFRRWTSGRVLLGVGNLINSVMNIFASLSRGFLQFFGFRILATQGTRQFLLDHGVGADPIRKIHEGRPNISDAITNGEIQLVINTPIGKRSRYDDSYIRKTAIKHKIPYITTMAGAAISAKGIAAYRAGSEEVRSLQEYHRALA